MFHIYLASILVAESKGLHSLATLTCTLLRKCLPKIPLPLSNKENPIKFHLPSQTPQVAVCSEHVMHKEDPSFHYQMHVCKSAPQLSAIPQVAASQSSLLSTSVNRPYARKAERRKKKSSSSSSSAVSSSSLEPLDLDPIPEVKTFPTQHKASEVYVLPLDSALVEESVDDVDNVCNEAQFFEITTAPAIDLSQFDKFFLELQDVTRVTAATCADVLHKTQSSPVLSLMTDKHTSKVDDFRSAPIVVPTAELPSSELNASDNGGISFKVQSVEPTTEPATAISLFETTASFAVSTATGTTCDQPVGFPKISEQPHPQLLGHTPPSVPEPYYKKTPAVERCRCSVVS